jgi:2,3-dihydroxybenzoate-AMP ligase
MGYVIRGVFGNFDFPAMADEIRPDGPTLTHVFVAGEPRPGQTALGPMIATPVDAAAIRGTLERLRPAPGEVALMLLSGGTTARPKLILRTQRMGRPSCVPRPRC